MDKTIVISTRCGQDSDCNPSNAGGILATTIGFDKLPDRFKSALNPNGKFSHTPYNFPGLVEVCKKLVRESVLRKGGRIEKDSGGDEIFVIPVEKPKIGKLEQCWEAGPIANSRFTEEEMEKIDLGTFDMAKIVEKFASGWKVSKCGKDMDPGLRKEFNGKKNVLLTHPLNQKTACVLSKKVRIPAGKKTILKLTVGHYPKGNWDLVVKAGKKELCKKLIDKTTAEDGWIDLEIDLSYSAGREVKLQLLNQANGWHCEAGLWAGIKIESE